jgi:hypothetical protein
MDEAAIGDLAVLTVYGGQCIEFVVCELEFQKFEGSAELVNADPAGAELVKILVPVDWVDAVEIEVRADSVMERGNVDHHSIDLNTLFSNVRVNGIVTMEELFAREKR